jgi:serine/threonine protein kinase
MKTCQQCGTEMPEDAPEGLCPRCLISAAARPSDISSEPTRIMPESGASANVAAASVPQIPDIGDPVAVGKCLPQFEILSLLGRGGMGVVYKARQLNLDRVVALKILPPVDSQSADFVERFRREARSLAKLSHPGIVAVHDFGESGGLYYFAMEFVDGANLREMIRTGKMRPEEALAVVPKICDALQFAHEEGVVHRDVKPENILIDKRGRVKIADFGLAKLLRREQTDHTLTMSGMTLGTPRYMAPEQLDKPETVDHRADIYSLGVVFYEMLTGEVPMGRFAPPSEKVRIDVRLDKIVLHALERDADRRYQHVSQVRDDVERVTSKPAAAVSAPAQTPAIPAIGKGYDAGGARIEPVPFEEADKSGSILQRVTTEWHVDKPSRFAWS